MLKNHLVVFGMISAPKDHPLLQVRSIILFVPVFQRFSFNLGWLKIVCIIVIAVLLYELFAPKEVLVS
jgi:hypothetical protein